MDAKDLDRIGGALTGARLAIAETGTLVLDGDRISGKRAITLVPDVHICVISRHQVVPSVPDAIAQLDKRIQHRLPMTFVSGPSATSDIEFNRVEGVHGPRTLVILLV
jgi:L-lactate dehydrogenase complex protein LldG